MKPVKDLFVRNELKKIFQHGISQVVLLTIVFALLIVALNQSIIGIKRIDEKYNNPFATYIQVSTRSLNNKARDRTTNIKKIIEDFGRDSIKKSFAIEKIGKVSEEYWPFINPWIGKLKKVKGRTYNVHDKLFTELTSSVGGNLIKLSNLKEDEINKIYSIVVTEGLVKDLGFDPNTIEKIPLKLSEDDFVLLPVKAVVKNMPQFADFMISNQFSYIWNLSLDQSNYANLGSSNKLQVLGIKDSAQLSQAIEAYLQGVEGIEYQAIVLDKDHIFTSNTFSLGDYPTETEKKDTISKIKALTKERIFNQYNLTYVEVDSTEEFASDLLEFKFSSLDSIVPFQQYSTEAGLDPDMQLVKIRQLFAEVSSISNVLGFGFLLFSIMMLVIFTQSFISRHIDEIRPNLGTLMAYGMPGKVIISTYQKVIFIIYLFALVAGSLLAVVISVLLNKTFGMQILLGYQIFVVLIIAILITLYYSKLVISKIFKKSPGDLIYKR